jgi:hypothetical protein
MSGSDYDFSRGSTEEKRFKNLLASTADGNIKGVFHESAVVDVASLIDGAGETVVVPVAGVELGDIVMGVSFGVDLVDMTVGSYVQESGVVAVRVQNESGSTVDLASTTVQVIVADVT